MKIMSIVGARPQFIKLQPLSKKLREIHEEVIVHTGQHYDDKMSTALFRDLNIPTPDYNLGVGSGSHGKQTGAMLELLEEVIDKESPGLVNVFGDTNTTLAGALAAVKLHVPVLHIEAGLRSYNRMMPEEINRVAVDHIADYLFAPTETAVENLEREGLASNTWLTGDIMADALETHKKAAERHSDITARLNLAGNQYYLLTLHRPYNVDSPETLSLILTELAKLDKPVVFPVHPRTAKVMKSGGISLFPGCITTAPLGYLDFLNLMQHSCKIITDSGGIQKEAYILRKPCITIRPETEWTETVTQGWNILASAKHQGLANAVMDFSPDNQGQDIFGSEVADTMAKIISGFTA